MITFNSYDKYSDDIIAQKNFEGEPFKNGFLKCSH